MRSAKRSANTSSNRADDVGRRAHAEARRAAGAELDALEGRAIALMLGELTAHEAGEAANAEAQIAFDRRNDLRQERLSVLGRIRVLRAARG